MGINHLKYVKADCDGCGAIQILETDRKIDEKLREVRWGFNHDKSKVYCNDCAHKILAEPNMLNVKVLRIRVFWSTGKPDHIRLEVAKPSPFPEEQMENLNLDIYCDEGTSKLYLKENFPELKDIPIEEYEI